MIKSTVYLHAEVAIRCLPIAVAAEVLVGAAVDEPLHLLHTHKIKQKQIKEKEKHLLKNFGKKKLSLDQHIRMMTRRHPLR